MYRCLLYKWRDHFAKVDAAPSIGEVTPAMLRRKVKQLKRVLADKTLEVDFFKGALRKSRGATPAERVLWRDGVYDQIHEMMPLQGRLSIERMCRLAQVSRAGFYRCLQSCAPAQEDLEVRSTIQTIAVEHRRRYGYRRITAELRRRGMLVT